MSEITIRSSLAGLEEYEVETIEAKIIVNANESNYPVPASIQQEIEEKTKSFLFNRYPPIKCETLCSLIAETLGVDIDKVRVGNGSSELLQMACYAFGGAGKKIAVPYPSFSMYGVYAQMSDSEVLRYPLNVEGFLDAEAVIAFCKENQPDLLILNNPNNPTGNYNPLSVILQSIVSDRTGHCQRRVSDYRRRSVYGIRQRRRGGSPGSAAFEPVETGGGFGAGTVK